MQKLLRIVIGEEEEKRREEELDGRNETWFRLAEAAKIDANRFISCNQRGLSLSLSFLLDKLENLTSTLRIERGEEKVPIPR